MGDNFVSENRCLECDTNMNVDIEARDYVCPKCGARYDREEYIAYKICNGSMPANKKQATPENPEKKEVEKMAAVKGTCIICKRDKMSIQGREHCGACYPIGKKFDWDNKKTIAYRKTHPVGKPGRRPGEKPRESASLKPRKDKHITPPSAFRPDDEVITIEKKVRIKFVVSTDVKEIEIID